MATILSLYGLNNKAGINNPYITTVIQEVTNYNSYASSASMVKNKKAMLAHLDNAMVAAAQWMTAKPKTATVNNQSRWTAMQTIAEDIPKIIKKELDAGTLSGGFKVDVTTKKLIGENYWLERIDPQHRPGFVLSKHYGKWQAEGTAGINFFTWLDPYVNELADDALSTLGMDMLFGVSPEQKREAEVTMKEFDFAQKHVAMNAPTIRDGFKLVIGGDGCLHDSHEIFCTKRHKTHFSGMGWAVFVVAPGYTIYAGSHIVGEFHHSTFLAGETVVAAGELLTNEFGKVLVVTGKSGHYRPTPLMTWRFVDYLRRAGLLAAGAVVKPDFAGSWASANDFALKKHRATPINGATASAAIPLWARNSGQVASIVGDTNAWPVGFSAF